VHQRDLALENMVRGYMTWTIPMKMEPSVRESMMERARRLGLPVPNRTMIDSTSDILHNAVVVSGSMKVVVKDHTRNSRKEATTSIRGLINAIKAF